jgi:glycosyltransferase involved in cell wall biosynthesis
MRLSVILSTYQNPAWLERSLWGYHFQKLRPLEVIIADDGSTNETAALIERMRASTTLNLVHAWHEDLDFRKCVILNEAIRRATGDYLVFSDGDCIPRRDFLETHARLAQAGRFLSGGTVRLPLKTSLLTDRDAIEQGDVFRPRLLLAHGFRRLVKLHRLALHGRLSTGADWLTTTRPTFNGHNSSAWKDDILRVNGFDERMEYGGLDRELGERLENAGIRGKQVRHQAVCVHLDHERPYVDKEKEKRNRLLRQETIKQRFDWTEFGIQKAKDEQHSPVILRFPTVQPQPHDSRRAAA